MLSAILFVRLRSASFDDQAEWGVSTSLFGSLRCSRGFSEGSGSEVYTSMPAPAIVPASRASANAVSSMIPPRATFIINAVGFINFSCALPISPLVLGVSGAWIEMISEVRSSSSSDFCG